MYSVYSSTSIILFMIGYRFMNNFIGTYNFFYLPLNGFYDISLPI